MHKIKLFLYVPLFTINSIFVRGIYSCQPEKYPPPFKILPYYGFFCGHLSFIKVFYRVFYHFFFLLLFPPFPFLFFMKSSFKNFTVYNLTNIVPRPRGGGGMARIYIPDFCKRNFSPYSKANLFRLAVLPPTIYCLITLEHPCTPASEPACTPPSALACTPF